MTRETQGSKGNGSDENLAFPLLEELVPPTLIRFGVEWAYVRAQNVGYHKKKGWKLCGQADSFELDGESWLVLQRGEPIRCSTDFVPRISAEDVSA